MLPVYKSQMFFFFKLTGSPGGPTGPAFLSFLAHQFDRSLLEYLVLLLDHLCQVILVGPGIPGSPGIPSAPGRPCKWVRMVISIALGIWLW